MSAPVAFPATVNPHDPASVHAMAGGGLPLFPPGGPSLRARGAGCWRIRPDGKPYPGLSRAIAAVHAAHPDRPDLHALAWALLPRLPGMPRTSANLKEEGAHSGIRPMEDAVVSDPWLGMNTELAVNVLWVESDKPDWRERLDRAVAAGMPEPVWTAEGTRGGHMGFILRTPVVSMGVDAEADRKRENLVSVTRSYACTAINGDHSAGLRGLTKNPFSSRWRVEVGVIQAVDLHDILDPLKALGDAEEWKAPARRWKGNRNREPSDLGRNCALFDLTRWWSCDGIVRDGAAILAKAEEVNGSFASPLGTGEVASVARSITRWMNRKYDGQGLRERLSSEAVRERRAAGGRKSGAKRGAARDEALRAAVLSIQARGEAPGQRQVAEEAGVCLGTVKRAWAMLWDVIVNPAGPAQVSALDDDGTNSPAASPAATFVNNGTVSLCHPVVVESGKPGGAFGGLPDPVAVVESLDPVAVVESMDPVVAALPASHPAPAPVALTPCLQVLLDAGEAVLRLPGIQAPVRLRGREAVQASIDAGHGPFLLPILLWKFLPCVKRLPTLPPGHDDWTAEGRLRRRRVSSAWNCEDRKGWHSHKAAGGSGGYSAATAKNHSELCKKRDADMARFDVDWPEPEPGVCPMAVAEARAEHAQRRLQAAMGWSSKFKAEHRINMAWAEALMVLEGRKPWPRLAGKPARGQACAPARLPACKPARVLVSVQEAPVMPSALKSNVAPIPTQGVVASVARFRTTMDAIDIQAGMADLAA